MWYSEQEFKVEFGELVKFIWSYFGCLSIKQLTIFNLFSKKENCPAKERLTKNREKRNIIMSEVLGMPTQIC